MKYDIIDNFKRTEKIQSELRFGDFNKVKDPFFSVVIPTYRRPDLLKETIMSAANQENFDFPYEIIVVDNEATDTINETELLIRDLDIENVYYYKNKKNFYNSICHNHINCQNDHIPYRCCYCRSSSFPFRN